MKKTTFSCLVLFLSGVVSGTLQEKKIWLYIVPNICSFNKIYRHVYIILDNYERFGCVNELPGGILRAKAANLTPNSPWHCQAFCTGYRYFGVEVRIYWLFQCNVYIRKGYIRLNKTENTGIKFWLNQFILTIQLCSNFDSTKNIQTHLAILKLWDK